MEDKPVINIVATRCQPQDEEKFNLWYNEVHIPMLLKSKRLTGVIRCKDMNSSSKLPQYIAIYKFANQKDFEEYKKSAELAAAIEEMQGTWADRIELTSRTQYELIKEW
ncbi:DUF4286 family protein [Chloroflexota bacterium]